MAYRGRCLILLPYKVKAEKHVDHLGRVLALSAPVERQISCFDYRLGPLQVTWFHHTVSCVSRVVAFHTVCERSTSEMDVDRPTLAAACRQ